MNSLLNCREPFIGQRRQLWECEHCHVARSWGVGENLTPRDYFPLLNCRLCHCPTRHVFKEYSHGPLPAYMAPEVIDRERARALPYRRHVYGDPEVTQ